MPDTLLPAKDGKYQCLSPPMACRNRSICGFAGRTTDHLKYASERVKIAGLFQYLVVLASVAAAFPTPLRAGERTTISLDGAWEIEDSKQPEAVPTTWNPKAPMPGLAHSAPPAFRHVDDSGSGQTDIESGP